MGKLNESVSWVRSFMPRCVGGFVLGRVGSSSVWGHPVRRYYNITSRICVGSKIDQ